MEPSKPIYQSKTFWANVLMAVASAVADNSGFGIPSKYAVPIGAVANILLRLISSGTVTVSGN